MGVINSVEVIDELTSLRVKWQIILRKSWKVVKITTIVIRNTAEINWKSDCTGTISLDS